ncbi:MULTISPECIES: peptidoglycan DD-metalloendopeptidase family protein [unclassified Leeuwenhoekiella]|uniref:peptidoglycan DD-metalloendopeptidase family protein n=1 Tax=unclassified Leeuwenhoekiella TaxID=2615029 RepID=UPI000C3F4861|nr:MULTISPECIES: peptidoglycan DD-metalloendopeptidase family protein [unclassified Leeuwenhoekiella]MAW94472.1 peptidase M23 [Leeuwenhoekiella sp.]MAW96968.1 peptidase M23 [Leeuwenhoekiella sp.]MBA81150.1 peptidase M23 [Leeuwenhoekiella sp.]|tara:strand:+ start:20364 stop:21062 length:699 start_codon:yes stop_codon:yes gene_type:complete
MNTATFSDKLKQLTAGFTPVIDTAYKAEDYRYIDLSTDNVILKEVDTASAKAIQHYISTYLSKTGGQVAYGGYLEKRSIYDRSIYFNNGNPQLRRNIHLGLDIWCPAGTPILAPVAGMVHSFKNNKNYGDYGPCIILEHSFEDLQFYTLYGHLSVDSLANLKTGQFFKAGERIAFLGDTSENGDYAPHLHFQIIRDMQGNKGDYPGVSTQNNLAFYKENCPDPQLLFKIMLQ